MTLPLPWNSRRHSSWRALTAAALTSALVLSACGSQSEDEEDADAGSDAAAAEDHTSASDPGSEPDADDDADAAPTDAAEAGALLPPGEGSTSYPLTLPTQFGETTLEERPERIAVIGFSTNSDMLEVLDVVPVYALTEDGDWEWRSQDWLDAVEFTDSATRRDPLNFEAIAAADPDLIVAVNFVHEQADYDRLASIAPVLDNPEPVVGDQIDWQGIQHLVAEPLDLSAAADEAIADAEAQIAETAAANPQFEGSTITIATEYESGLEYYTTTGGTAEQALGEIGFAPNPLAEGFVNDPVVSDENLGQLDADVLVVIYQDAAARDAREAQPLFQAIPAVADGRYVAVDAADDPAESGINATWVFRRGASALSLPWGIDVVANTWLTDVDLG